MPRKHADFTDGPHRAGTCQRWCKVHWWWNFQTEDHEPYPQMCFWKQDNGWARVLVHVGPPAYHPKRPTPEQWAQMKAVCPHDPPQLTCDNCRRHEFRAVSL